MLFRMRLVGVEVCCVVAQTVVVRLGLGALLDGDDEIELEEVDDDVF